MELYTLVSLMVGLFGGTFAALNNLRSLLDSEFQKNCQAATDRAKAIIDVKGEGHEATIDSTVVKDRVEMCSKVWKYISIAHVSFFTLLIYAVTFLALRYWNDVAKKHTDLELTAMSGQFPWNYTSDLLMWSAFINLLFIATIFVLYLYCRTRIEKLRKIQAYGKDRDVKAG